MKSSVIIIGGGLAGLTAAHHLHHAGIGFGLLEARDRLGGRIQSTDANGKISGDGFDLGPSWFWPGMQSAMSALVDDLGLPFFAQHSDGDMLFQRTPDEAPRRFRGFRQEPESMRLAGGIGTIVTALASGLPQPCIQLSTRVTQVAFKEPEIEVRFIDANGVPQNTSAPYVILTLPPRLLEATVALSPPLDAFTARNWRETPTWMASHAKFFAFYERPFWREAGLSGTAQSAVGPLAEIHDATTASGKAALFGFFGFSAPQRTSIGKDALARASIQQLERLFGAQAGSPSATLLKDWATDPFTATNDDQQGGGHPISGGLAPVPAQWKGRLFLAGTEAGRREAGYLGGAVEAAEYAVGEIINQLERGA